MELWIENLNINKNVNMKEQMFLMVDDADDVNHYLERGWEVISVTAQHVSVSTAAGGWTENMVGKFAVVIQKQK